MPWKPLLLGLLASLSLASQSPEYPPEGRTPIDRFLLVKPYTRSINKFQPLGTVLATMSEVRLTSDAKSMAGSIWSKETLGMDAFTVEARLRISSTRSSAVIADGIGIWFTLNKSLGSAFGINPSFTGFGVVLDIYDNTYSRKTPFIGLVASNGTIPLDSDSNGEKHTLSSCKLYESGALIRDGKDHNARESIAVHIEYRPGKMGVYYKMERDLDWEHCFTYNNIFIPNYFFLGVSASTGDLSAQQDLLSLKVSDLPVDLAAKARSSMHFDQTSEASKMMTPSGGGKIFSVLFFTFAFFVVVGGMIIIIKPELLPGTQASIDRKKRFY